MEAKLINTSQNNYIEYSEKEVSDFMKIIKKEILTDLNSEEEANLISSPSDEQNDYLYLLRYTRYIKEEFNISIVNMINYYIIKFKTFPKHFRNEPNFTYKIIDLLKHLFINEIELSCFTLLFEIIGLKYKKLDYWLYLTILGIYTKKLSGAKKDLNLLINYFSRNYPLLVEEYTSFINDEATISKIHEGLTLKDINKRFQKLKKPMNSYCEKNYINIHGIIDKIVKMSQPYNMTNLNRINKKNIKKPTKKIVNNNSNENYNVRDLNYGINQISLFEEVFNEKNDNIDYDFDDINFGDNIYNLNYLKDMNFFNLNFDLSNLDNLNSIIY